MGPGEVFDELMWYRDIANSVATLVMHRAKKSSRSQVHMEKFSWTNISHKRRVTMLSLASIPLNCNTGMDRDELLKWGAQPGNGHGRYDKYIWKFVPRPRT